MEIPTTPLDLHYNNNGLVPHIGLHRHGKLYVQESSYSAFWLSGIILIVAIVVAALPWETKAVAGTKLKDWVVGGCIFWILCTVLPYFIRNAFGQSIIIDPEKQTLRIWSRNPEKTILWRQIIGLQICHEKVERDSELTGHQLNLVWINEGGIVRRHCLLKHGSRRFVAALGKRYQALFAFKLLDGF
jgi:hypothetical protein